MLHILVSDQDKSVRSYIKSIVTALGHIVIGEASNSDEISKIMMDKGWPNVLITDIMEPDLGGLKIARQIYEQQLPIDSIILGASFQHRHIQHAMRSGALDYLVKPVDSIELCAALERADHRAVLHSMRHRQLYHIHTFFERLPSLAPSEALQEQSELLAHIFQLKESLKGERRALLFSLSMKWHYTLEQHQLAYPSVDYFERKADASIYFRRIAEYWIARAKPYSECQPQPIIKRVCDYLHKHFQEQLTLTEICQRFDISVSYFSKRFKEHTGLSFIPYMNRVRIEHAKQLLLNTDLMIYEIAMRSGFPTQQYFNRVFKNEAGLTPHTYRMHLGA